jgi:AcrR family transcriptional regulator
MAPRTAALSRRMRASARERILSGSISAFAEKGFHGTSMDDVAASAGVSKGLAYVYFRSKEDLLVRAVKERIEHLFDVGTSINRSMPPRQRLAALIDALLSQVRRDPDVFRLYLSLTLEKSMAPVAAGVLRAMHAPLNRYLEVVRDVFADLGSDDPDLDALIFRSTLLGLFLRFVRSIEDVPIDQIRTRLIRTFQSCGQRRKASREGKR